MRATATPSPVGKGKRRLLESCAITAGLAALAYGGPALAQVQANPVFVNVGAGTSINNNGTTKTTTVNVTQAQSIINWIPTDTAPTGGDINLLPADSTWNFNGNGNYIVLNRFVNGAGGALSRQIALSGTINSTNSAASGAQGGSIWFYNAGGILINNGAAINVGSLVLTTNDVLTTGGLLGPTGEIRFRGASGSTSTITNNGNLNVAEAFNPGGSYVALVAPRIVQSGNVSVDGSAAYVAAEQVDIRTNNGLFDINVLVGAEGGNVITHTGNTTGPAHQQGDTDQNRIYMVAIPKNDAVTMLVRGAIGYDDALSAQVDPDGAVRLSAGYNITAGELDAAPANATAANMTVSDTLFRSDTFARASGDFLAQPISQLPPPVLPFAPPPGQGRVLVQGTGTFIGDASATFNIGTGQLGGATGSLTVQSGGVGGTPGVAAVNVSGGTLIAGSTLAVQAPGPVDALTGNSQGGTASLNITGGTVSAAAVQVEANGIADIGSNGIGGTGRGGTASISVSNAGSTLTAGNIFINSIGRGDGTFVAPSGALAAVDNGGDGQGGTSTLTIANGATVGPVTLLSLDARGFGAVGLVQSGSGAGGTARIQLSGAGSSLSVTQQTFLQAGGDGGTNFSSPLGTFLTQNGGDAVGGTAELIVNADATASASLGAFSANALARGGNASAGENSSGGNAQGGAATVTANGGVDPQFSTMTLNASALAGGGSSPSGISGVGGNADAGTVTLTASNGSAVASSSGIQLFGVGMGIAGENFGTGTGGDVIVNATSGGSIDAAGQISVQAMGGSASSALAQSAGSGTGGNVSLTANGGSIVADNYSIDTSASVVNVTGASGPAQGGTIGLTASNAGSITARNNATDLLLANATSGVSAGGTSATGGAVQLIANAGTIALSNPDISVGGVSGGATSASGNTPVGTGGSILLRVSADPASQMSFGGLDAAADGRTASNFEATPGIPRDTAGDGQGGSIAVEVLGGTFSTGSSSLSASGFGGRVAGGNTGTGGTATFTQTDGASNIQSMSLSADGFGGSTPGTSGDGVGGTAIVNLNGGTLNGGSISASANGLGGGGINGDDFDSANPVLPSNGGTGQGGTATINVQGTAVITTSLLSASAFGSGGGGGDFSSFNGASNDAGNGGQGIGGTATINLTSGDVTSDAISVDSGGFGGSGGDVFSSSSSGSVTGLGVGGTGGTGSGGTSTVNFDGAAVTVSESVMSQSAANGGSGGSGSVGGAGGNAVGGLAQAIVNNYDPGVLFITLNASATGGDGGSGDEGAGGDGGSAQGGMSRIEAAGAGANLIVSQDNFATTATGGRGGTANGNFFGGAVGANGGNGGAGTGGTIQIVATDGGNVGLGASSSGATGFDSSGTGGTGGDGAFNAYDQGRTGGNGGNGGSGVGGTVNLLANGGTITSDGAAVTIVANGISGLGGTGGSGIANPAGVGGNGVNGGSLVNQGGRVVLEAMVTPTGAGQIALGDTTIDTSGFLAGRIELRTDSSIAMTSLTANASGSAPPTNNDTDEAPAGIFLATTGGTISTSADMSLRTDGSVGVYGQAGGQLDVGGNLVVQAGDQVDLRHEFRNGSTAPTILTGGDMSISAGNSITGALGTRLEAGGTLTLATTGPNGQIGVDRLDGTDIVMTTAGAASVEHAEAANDFTATAGTFRTGLNSIITGGDILINAVGAVDLGNSSAGGAVAVTGQSIDFNNIDALQTIDLNATGTTAGAEGIRGVSLAAGGNTNLFGNSIAITGNVTGDASFFAFGLGGNVAVNQANVAGTISIFSAGNLTGAYVAGGDVRLNATGNVNVSATANGGYVDPNGVGTEGNLYVEAGGNVIMTNSAAARMFGVNAGGSAAITGGNTGEDLLVNAGTTATLANITAGDDITVAATGDITATNVNANGTGGDTHFLIYGPSGGFTITLGEGISSIDGSDVRMTSGGSINATGVSAGDDIFLTATGAAAVNGATTSGLGITGGDSSVAIQAASATATGVNAFDDVTITTAGTTSLTGTVAAGRNVTITANTVALETLTGSGGSNPDTIAAGGNVTVASATTIIGGRIRGLGNVDLNGGTDIVVDSVDSGGTTALTSAGGNIDINNLNSVGDVDASANSIRVGNGGNLTFNTLTANTGGATVRTGGNLIVLSGTVAGDADLQSGGSTVRVDALTANNITLNATNGSMQLNAITATNNLNASADGLLQIAGVVTGRSISLASADITIDAAARVGTAATTQQLSVANNDSNSQTFVGGTGARNGFHIDASELTRLFGTDVEIFAPEVTTVGVGSVGSSAPPDVVVDSFTFTGGAAGSNLGANGSLTIRTPGKMRVIGNVQLTGLADTNQLNLRAGEALEVILGQGTVRLVNGSAPAGRLNMVSDDIIVATPTAIADVGAATTTDAIETRLAQNDGVVLDEGALFARGITFDVVGGVYVQNSGAGTKFGERRGLTFGAGGLDILTEDASTRIVINGVQLGANGQVIGLDTVPLLTIGGAQATTLAPGSFDPRSTFNGCVIAASGTCSLVTFDRLFPVRDVIDDVVDSDDDPKGDGSDGGNLPSTALITTRDIDPLSGEPLLDDPVTGAGNDDLWTPTTDIQQP